MKWILKNQKVVFVLFVIFTLCVGIWVTDRDSIPREDVVKKSYDTSVFKPVIGGDIQRARKTKQY